MLAVTVVFFIIARLLTHSRIGTVLKSIRDNDTRAEFMGYNVANYRIFVFCVSAFMSAAAGAMYAAWVGIVSFLDTGPLLSVEAVIWTAVGGRATLIGPFLGAFLVARPRVHIKRQLVRQLLAVLHGCSLHRRRALDTRWFRRHHRQLAQSAPRGTLRPDARGARPPRHDRQRDWEPAGAPKSGDEMV